MAAITVSHLKKYYQIHKTEPGFSGSMKALFNRQYTDAKAVDDISFSIEEGELIGFIGPNGAGKTTTLKCLSGLLYPTSGTVSVLGNLPSERKPEHLKQISLVMGQKNQLWWDLPAQESFALNREIYEVPHHTYKRIVDELSDLLEVKDILGVQVRKLSLGQRMKCELIAALIHSPKVLFLDEPTIGLDVLMQQKLREFVKEYNNRFNATIILTSHYMKDVEELCKRVIIIDKGTILYDGLLSDIVRTYTDHKLLSIIFHNKVTIKEMEKLGSIHSFDPYQVVLSIPREKTNEVAAHLLKTFPVEDLNVQEIPLEEIIGKVFLAQKNA